MKTLVFKFIKLVVKLLQKQLLVKPLHFKQLEELVFRPVFR
jgi:hypothetical protein